MTERPVLESIPVQTLAIVTGGAGADPAMTAKGEAISFGGTGCNGPANGRYDGGGNDSPRMTWQ